MTKLVQSCLIIASLLSLTGCAILNMGGSGSAESFRLHMARGYSAHKPALPANPKGQWNDVENWQQFLVTQHCLVAGTYKVNNFDSVTVTATKLFQKKKGKVADYELPQTGCVNLATYRKAIQEGMTKYTLVKSTKTCAQKPVHDPHHHRLQRSTHPTSNTQTVVGDTFRDGPMAMNCTDGTLWDVDDWQTFLVVNDFLASNAYNPGVYGQSTVNATIIFQKQYVPGANLGKVDHATWTYANNFSINTQGLGASLVSHDGVTPTVESPTTSCNKGQ